MTEFKNGMRLSYIEGNNGEWIVQKHNNPAIESISIVMQNGQMAPVPWAKVTYNNGQPPTLYNLALVESVGLEASDE